MKKLFMIGVILLWVTACDDSEYIEPANNPEPFPVKLASINDGRLAELREDPVLSRIAPISYSSHNVTGMREELPTRSSTTNFDPYSLTWGEISACLLYTSDAADE